MIVNNELEHTLDTTKDATIQRLQEFSYYLTESIEKNLTFCLTLLEDKLTSKKPNSTPVTAISAIATPIPYIGRGISSALKEGEIYIVNQIDNSNSRSVADLIYYFSDNKETMRQLLIESSLDIFYCFEQQFMKLTCEGGHRRAMQKLAKDAANRIFSHFLKNKQNGDINKDDFSKGVIFGDSLKNKFGVTSGKTVKNEEKEEWKTSSIYKKVGLFFDETNEFFGCEETKSGKYGYRRVFTWENIDEIRTKWSAESSETPDYYLKKEDLAQLFGQIRQYVMKKSVMEEAQLDRETKHEEVMDDQEKKHEEAMTTFIEKFAQVFEDLSRNYEEIKTSRRQTEVIITTIKEEQIVQEDRHQEISNKLSEIHIGVVETKEEQVILTQRTENIQNEICEIKTKQEELSGTAIEVREAIQQVSLKNPSLSDLVKDNYEVKKVVRVVNEVKENLGNVEPKVRREVKKGLKKLFR